jgi:hypothetical protein
MQKLLDNPGVEPGTAPTRFMLRENHTDRPNALLTAINLVQEFLSGILCVDFEANAETDLIHLFVCFGDIGHRIGERSAKCSSRSSALGAADYLTAQ